MSLSENLGKKVRLMIVKEVEFGVYLGNSQEKVLLPKKQVPRGLEAGDPVEVFLYKDSSDRLIATTNEPKITLGELAALKVCLEAGALPREEFGRFCDESCLGLWELAKKNPEKGWALPVYDYLRRLRVRVEANASASAMSGALAAYCGGLLFAQS